MAGKFVHLHVHTEYSLLDGLSNIGKLMTHVKENGMDAVAITDHGTMHGAIEFYKEAKKAEVKPIIGMEAYTTNIDLESRPERGKFKNNHLLLLAKNSEGYKNLMRLTSIAHLKGYYYRPRLDRKTLKEFSKGLICTSACMQGEVAQAILNDDLSGAKKIVTWFLDVFGKDYYLEIQRHKFSDFVLEAKESAIRESVSKMADEETKVNEQIIKLSRELGVPLIATNDAHYIKVADAQAQDALVCIATGKQVKDIKRLRFIDTPTFYVKSPSEMEELFQDYPESLENTVKIAEKCNLTIALDKWYFPKYVLPEGKTAEKFLKEKAWDGANQIFGKDIDEEIKKRLKYELDIINQKGYATYFLAVSDMTKWAREHNIITNTRGSAAGSLVSYCVGIININPLTYGLTFERFLTPWRPTPPDIDLDIADDKREMVIDYLIEKFGVDKVAQICTFGRMLSRAAVRDVARVLGYPYSTGDRIAKLIPPPKQGFPITIEKAMTEVPELKRLFEEDNDSKAVLRLAIELEGTARHVSVHAAGVVIAPTSLTDYVPVQLEGERKVTQYDMGSLDPNVSPGEAIGLLKFDLLGLRNLSILGAAMKILKDSRNILVDLSTIPLKDKKTFEMLGRGETTGVFQLSSSGMTKWLKELKPNQVEDLMAMVALYRPGPMQFIPEYIERKRNPQKVTYIDPRMKEYMGKSYGLMIYQEDVLLTAINIAGYTWEESDKFRKAVGKKIPEEMAKQHDKFVEGSVKNGLGRKKAEDLFGMIEKFAAYGFNKAHSASYGMVAYWTGYLKANYPVEYMAALLTAESGDKDKISLAISECRKMRIKVLPPDINESAIGFKIVKDKDSLGGRAIRFGLSAIKNVGKAAIEAILAERKKSQFSSFPDFIGRVDARRVNKRVLESLIKVGAMNAFGARAAILSSIDLVRAKTSKKTLTDQQGLFLDKDIGKAGKSAISSQILSQIPEFSEEELEGLERQLLGFSLTGKTTLELISPFSILASHKVQELMNEIPGDQKVKLAGVIREVRIIVTKKSAQEMAFVKVEDETGSINLVIFPRVFSSTRDLWVANRPVLVGGRLDARDDEVSLIVDFVEKEAKGIPNGGEVSIHIPSDCGEAELANLKRLLKENPGNQAVCLVFEIQHTTVRTNLHISWSAHLARQISEILHSNLS